MHNALKQRYACFRNQDRTGLPQEITSMQHLWTARFVNNFLIIHFMKGIANWFRDTVKNDKIIYILWWFLFFENVSLLLRMYSETEYIGTQPNQADDWSYFNSPFRINIETLCACVCVCKTKIHSQTGKLKSYSITREKEYTSFW